MGSLLRQHHRGTIAHDLLQFDTAVRRMGLDDSRLRLGVPLATGGRSHSHLSTVAGSSRVARRTGPHAALVPTSRKTTAAQPFPLPAH